MAETVPFGYKHVGPKDKKRLVREQFDLIAATYDLADAVLSAGLDSVWRRKSIRLLGLQKGDRVLDVCGGTARVAVAALQRAGPDGRAVVYDFNRAMIERGRGAGHDLRVRGGLLFVQGDAESLSFSADAFDAVTVGFGLRNLVNPQLGLTEMRRVLRPGGALMILEFSLPVRLRLRQLYRFYSFRVMPWIGRLICGTAAPFCYLAESIRVFAPPQAVADLLRRTGFADVRFVRFADGLVVAYYGRKPLG